MSNSLKKIIIYGFLGEKKYHIMIYFLGGGAGGVACARTSSALGAKVGLAEGGRLGGICVNRGCVPEKFLLYASHAGEDICNSTSLGWSEEKHTF